MKIIKSIKKMCKTFCNTKKGFKIKDYKYLARRIARQYIFLQDSLQDKKRSALPSFEGWAYDILAYTLYPA